MKTDYLSETVIKALVEIKSKSIKMDNNHKPFIVRWGCGGGCEGLSTPIV